MLFVVGVSAATVFLVGCGSPQSSSANSTAGTMNPSTVSSVGVTTTVPVSTTSATAPGDTTAQAKALAFAAASASLSQAVGVPRAGIKESTLSPMLRGSYMALAWDGGFADIDVTGRILTIIQDWPTLDPNTPFLTDSELDHAANQAAAMLGWNDETLAGAGFTVGKSGIASQVSAAYVKSWVEHDVSGVLNSGLVELRLDARNGRILSFFFQPGAGDIDASGAISRDRAVELAKIELAQNAVQPMLTEPGETSQPHPALAIDATLKVTDAPAVTGGKTMLVWVIHLTGYIGEKYVGGTAYLDAKTGDVLVSLVDG